jgi:hypothetical protein
MIIVIRNSMHSLCALHSLKNLSVITIHFIALKLLKCHYRFSYLTISSVRHVLFVTMILRHSSSDATHLLNFVKFCPTFPNLLNGCTDTVWCCTALYVRKFGLSVMSLMYLINEVNIRNI